MTELRQADFQKGTYEMSLRDVIFYIRHIVKYLRTKWVLILLAGFLGAGIGFLYAYSKKTVYTAALTFALEDEKGGGGLNGALSLASSFGLDLGTNAGGAFSGANLIELMRSRRLVEQSLLKPVIVEGKQVSLAEMYITINEWRKSWDKIKGVNEKLQFKPNADRGKFTIQQDSVLGLIYSGIIEQNLKVAQKDKKTSIITVEVKSENELFAKYFAEVLTKEVSDFYIDTKSKKAAINFKILEKQADSIRTALNSAITGVAVENDNTYNLNPALNVKRTPSARRQIDVQANTVILSEMAKNLEMARVTLRKETPLIQVIDRPILPLTKEKISKRGSILKGGVLSGFLMILILLGIQWWRRLLST